MSIAARPREIPEGVELMTAAQSPGSRDDQTSEPRKGMTTPGVLGFSWGVGGVVLLLVGAIGRLFPVAVTPLGDDLELVHAVAYAASIVLFGYAEGYRAFQRRFAPRVVARGFHLGRNPKSLHVLLAPFFCMGYFGATRRRIVASWGLTGGIVLLVALVGALPHPWRGIIDAGVTVGIGWGTISIMVLWILALAGSPPAIALDLPEPSLGPPRADDR